MIVYTEDIEEIFGHFCTCTKFSALNFQHTKIGQNESIQMRFHLFNSQKILLFCYLTQHMKKKIPKTNDFPSILLRRYMRYGSTSTLVIFITSAEVQSVSLLLTRVAWIVCRLKFENTTRKTASLVHKSKVFHLFNSSFF